MALRTENGWYQVPASACDWVSVPGTAVTLQIQRGWPLIILRAFAADFNAYIEPLRDADSACWTPTNSVATSNHLSGTAMDLNWNGPDGKTFRLGISEAEAYPGDKAGKLRELLDWYEGIVFCGGKWSIRDWMHFQLGGDTYRNPRVADFILRKIRGDGYSTYQRGNAVVLSRKDRYALATINEGKRLGITPKGICIALAVELVETELTMYANRNVPASLGYPHDAVGSDHDSTGLFQQRQAWGPLSSTMDPTKSAYLFFTGGMGGQRGLTDFDYNSDARTPGGWAQAVQVSAYPDRYDKRFAEAQQIYNRLTTTTAPIDPWEELLMLKVPSMSIYADPGEPDVAVVDMIRALDAHGPHEPYVESQARAGDPDALMRVVRTASGKGKYGAAPGPVNQARRVLAEIEAANPGYLQAFLQNRQP